jgi:copper transport protein
MSLHATSLPQPPGVREKIQVVTGGRSRSYRAGVRRLRRLLVLLALSVLASVAAATSASAHATLESTVPADGQLSRSAPTAVVLRFDEQVEGALGAARVFASDGSRVDVGPTVHPGGDGSQMRVALKSGLARGTYLVDWRVVSADSHPVSGSFTFSIGARGAVAAVSSNGDAGLQVPLGVSRFANFLGVVMLVGTLAFLLVCWPSGWAVRRTRRLVQIGTAVAILGTGTGLVLQGAYDAGRPASQGLNPAVLHALITTRLGQAYVLRLLLLLAIGLTLSFGVPKLTSGPRRTVRRLLAVESVAVLATIAGAGHAATGRYAPMLMPVDLLHLLAVSVWLGGLVVLATVLLRRDPAAAMLDGAVQRFSAVAATCVGVIVVTGVVLAVPEIGAVQALPSTTYGNLLITKVSLLASMLLVAAGSRAAVRRMSRTQQVGVLEPERVLVAAGSQQGTTPPPLNTSRAAAGAPQDDVKSLRRSVVAELVLGAVILAVTATLVATPPAKIAYRPTLHRELKAGPVTIDLSAVPTTGTRTLTVRANTLTSAGQPFGVPELRVRASLPSRAIAPLDIPLKPNGTGHFLSTGVRLPLAGDWRLEIYVRTTDIDSFTAVTQLDVR